MSKSELDKIKTILNILSIDPFDFRLKTHKLQGKLSDYFSCTCGYDCRIIFSIDDSNIEYQVIYLIDIGSHDEVY